ncbi:MAG: amidohydrolase family protein [Gemmatimonadales bacterium]
MRYLLLASLLALPLAAQDTPQAFTGGTIIPISGSPIMNGVLVVHQGRITAVGAVGQVPIPAGAQVHDVTGKFVMPGLVDTHSHIGGGDGGDQSGPIHPAVRILDAIDARHDRIRTARAGGITTANIMPGSGLLMSGQTAYVKLRDGNTIYDLLYCRDVQTEICGGMKMANGTNSIGASPRPGTRARSAMLVRARFVAAQEYQRRLAEWRADTTKARPARDLELEALIEVLDGRRTVHFHTHRHDDILTALRLAQEFGFRIVLQHVSEAWKVANEIRAANAPASIIVIDAPGGKLEAMDLLPDNGRVLEEAGVQVAFHTDDGITDSRFFLRSAALGVRFGMSREGALRAMTLAPAHMLGLGDRIGSLEVGKDADFIILSADPLSIYARVEQTWIDGLKLFDLSNPTHRAYAEGGYNVTRDLATHVHAGMEGHH